MVNAIKSGETGGRPRAVRVARCELSISDSQWDYAIAHGAAIAHHWQQQKEANPNYFNGTIYLLKRWAIGDDGATFQASFLRTDFRSYLYWRNQCFEDADVWDAFGSALVRSIDGAFVLGRQCPGNVNAGLSYPPSGFIDDKDIAARTIDIDGHVAREVFEETGLPRASLLQQPGYWIAFDGAQVSIAVTLQSSLTAGALAKLIGANLAEQEDRELFDIHLVRSMPDLENLVVPPYVTLLMTAVFEGQ